LGLVGANVTAPHKALAATYCHSLTPRAQCLGVVNTLTWSEGRIEGHNTDVDGVILTLQELVGGDFKDLEGAHLRLVGAGGAARAVAWAALELGVGSLEVVARREESAQALCAWLNEHSSAISTYPLTLQALSAGVTRGDTPLVTCLSTPPLTQETLSALFGEKKARVGEALFDLNYGPRAANTSTWCAEQGVKVLDGALMLAEQGRRSFERWTGGLPPRDVSVRSLKARH
jgi:shikimate dehydrogenase